MEMMVNKRHLNYLVQNNFLDKYQSRFRKYRSTDAQTTNLAQETEDAYKANSKMLWRKDCAIPLT